MQNFININSNSIIRVTKGTASVSPHQNPILKLAQPVNVCLMIHLILHKE